MRFSTLTIVSVLVCTPAFGADARRASMEEIQQLFDLATVRPQRSRIVVEITWNEPKWSDEQVIAELIQQNELFRDIAQAPESHQRARTNAVRRGHSGSRTAHMQEWNSGKYYRTDVTDEGLVLEEYLKKYRGKYTASYVTIDDPAISPYQSASVDHNLRSVMLSKTVRYSTRNLWQAKGLEEEVSFPIISSVLDYKSSQFESPGNAGVRVFKMSHSKAEQLHNDGHPIWHLVAIPENDPRQRTRFIMRGKYPALDAPSVVSDVEYVYELTRDGTNLVCSEARYTNHTVHTSYTGKREDFDAQGFPRIWRITKTKPGTMDEETVVVFKEVEWNPIFKDQEVFWTQFPSNYLVADVTSGPGVILQKPVFSRSNLIGGGIAPGQAAIFPNEAPGKEAPTNATSAKFEQHEQRSSGSSGFKRVILYSLFVLAALAGYALLRKGGHNS